MTLTTMPRHHVCCRFSSVLKPSENSGNMSHVFTLHWLAATSRRPWSSDESSELYAGRASSSRWRASSPHARTNPDVRFTPSAWILVSTGRTFDDGIIALFTNQHGQFHPLQRHMWPPLHSSLPPSPLPFYIDWLRATRHKIGHFGDVLVNVNQICLVWL